MLSKKVFEDFSELIRKAKPEIDFNNRNNEVVLVPYIDEFERTIRYIKFVWADDEWKYCER